MNLRSIADELQMEEPEIRELMELFITTTLRDMDKIREAVKKNDFENATATAHSIKGAAANMKLDEISSLAKQVETDAREGRDDTTERILAELSREIDAIARQTGTGN